MIERGTMPTDSLCAHLSMKTQDMLSILSLQKRDLWFSNLSQICLCIGLSSYLHLVWGYLCPAQKVRKCSPDNGLSKWTSAKSFILRKGLGTWSWQSQMSVLYDCCLIILIWFVHFYSMKYNIIPLKTVMIGIIYPHIRPTCSVTPYLPLPKIGHMT